MTTTVYETIEELLSCFALDQYIVLPGLFLVAANFNAVKTLRERIHAGERIDPSELLRDPYVAGSLFKIILQDLPEPLVSSGLQTEFIALCQRGTYDAEFQENLHDLLVRVPPENRELLRKLLELLSKLAAKSQQNGLVASKLSLAFSRCFVRATTEKELHTNGHASVLVKYLLEEGPQIVPNSQGTSQRRTTSQRNLTRVDGKALRVISGFDSQQGKRKTMEDAHVTINHLNSLFPRLPRDIKRSFYAVFDGHSGRKAADLAEKYLHHHIATDPLFAQGEVKQAIQNGFQKTDEVILALANQENPRWKDGTTAAILFIDDRTLYAANLGDSEIVLGRWKPLNASTSSSIREAEAIPLSHKHKPTNADEKSRIEGLGGMVFQGRLFGTLAVARALGDSDMKRPASPADYVSAEPFISEREIKIEDSFVILACDGLWDKVSHQQAVDLVAQGVQEQKDAKTMAAQLVKKALDSGSSDNVTVVIVLFKWDNLSTPTPASA